MPVNNDKENAQPKDEDELRKQGSSPPDTNIQTVSLKKNSSSVKASSHQVNGDNQPPMDDVWREVNALLSEFLSSLE